eukprot:9036453-Pyramimonas_sp.AAC.2
MGGPHLAVPRQRHLAGRGLEGGRLAVHFCDQLRPLLLPFPLRRLHLHAQLVFRLKRQLQPPWGKDQ